MEDLTEVNEITAEKTVLEQFNETTQKSRHYRDVEVELSLDGDSVILKTTKNGTVIDGELKLKDSIWTWDGKPTLEVISQPLEGAIILFADRV